jgi:anhydro-N-acetylmuramic acid kinase
VLNLGGIANLTLLPPAGGPDRRRPVLGWDCGPANTLLDLAVERFSEGRARYDEDGGWAARGAVDEPCLRRWLQEPYFQQDPPKSTGRELFGAADLEHRLGQLPPNPADALATLSALTAAVVAQDLGRGPRPLELLVAGGGARNRAVMEQLRQRCAGIVVRPLGELGIADDQREALAFALLAWWQRRGHPGSLPSVTGAPRAAVLGVRAEPP